MLPAKTVAGNKISFQFETWLVCVIEDKQGKDKNTAKDDTYKVAPLLGWTWGYDIAYKDQGKIGEDELGDFTVTKKALAFTKVASADWKKAIDKSTVYGSPTGTQDFFNVTLGDCTQCAVPAPPSAILLLLGGLGIVGRVVWHQRALRVRGS
jgi:hypothetical protein